MPADTDDGAFANAAFVKVHAYFFNIDRGTSRLLRLIRTGSAALGIIQWCTPFLSIRLRSSATYLLSAIGLRCAFARVRRVLGDDRRLVSLPDRGDVAMYCYPDRIRIFDLKEHRIANICNPDSRESRQHLAAMLVDQTMLGEMGIAPRIYGWEDDSNYIEELCDGMPLKSRDWWKPDMFHEVTALARAVQSTKPRTSVCVKDVVDELNEQVASLKALYAAAIEEVGGELIDEIQAACDAVDRDQRLDRFLSHGDLARRNILVRRDDSLVFIDWHTLDYRVEDYDVYNYHFSIVEDGTAGSITEQAVFDLLDQVLGVRETDVALKGLNAFRLEYFTTRLNFFVPRNRPDAERVSKILAQMRGYAECFRRYEQHCRKCLPAA